MENTTETPKSKLHPLMAGAAGAVIIASLVAVAAITGNLPGSSAQKGPDQQASGGATAPAAKPAQQSGAPKQLASAPTTSHAKARCADCGVVVDVKEVVVKGESSGIGAVAGGVGGAVIGHEVMSGKNQGLATIAGGVVGAVAGNEIEKHAKTHKRYDVAVRMEDGSTKTVAYAEPPTWRSGDRVKVAGATLEPAK
jgi:outer membrane lipoprotein SlyB